jgi:hypothetical protein
MDTKQQLQKLIEQIKAKQFRDNEAQGLTKSVGGEITKQLKPAFEGLAKELTGNISQAIKELKVNVPEGKEPKVTVNVPDVIVPDIKVPEPKVTVNIPPFPKIPEFPKLEMPEMMEVVGKVEIGGNDYSNPLAVRLVDLNGRPYESVGGGGFSGGAVKINNTSSEAIPVYVTSGATATSATNIVDSSGVAYSGSNPMPITGSVTLSSESITLDQETDSIAVRQVSGFVDSVNVLTMPAITGTVAVSSVTGSLAASLIDSSGIQYSGSNPLPVTITAGATATTAVQNLNADGTYRDTFPVSGSVTISGTVTGITNTVGVYNLDSAGNYKDTQPVSGSVAVSGITGSIGATILNGEGLARDSWLVSDITNSVKSSLIDSSGVQYSGSNPFPIRAFGNTAGDGTGNERRFLVDNDGNLQVDIANGVSVTGNVTVSDITASIKSALIDSTGVQYSGSNPLPITMVTSSVATTAGTILNGDGTYRDTFPISGTITGITNTIAVLNVDSGGVGYSGSNPLPITIISTASAGATGSLAVSVIGSDGLAFGTSKPIPVTMVAGVSGTTGTANVDSSGVQYSGSNPMPTYLVAGSGNSTVSVGAVVSDAVDDGSAPIKHGGIARTANPTAVAGGDIVTYSADDLGRQITRPVQARDLIATAYVSKATGSTFGTETTLLAATAGSMFDLIYVMGANDSDAAINVDIRGVTAGNVLMSLYIPATGTAGLALPVPFPQTTSDTGNAWTIDLPDVTGTNVNVSALFTKEV